MKTTLACIVLVACVLAAQAREYAPRAAVEQSTASFGQRMETETATCRYKISNHGNLTLEIGRIYSSCGCTDVRMPSRSLAPGESMEVEVDVDLKGRSGLFNGFLRMETNDPQQRNLELRFEGTVISAWEITPRHVFFRALGRDDARTVSTTVKFNHEPTVISEVVATADFVTVELTEIERGREYAIDVTTVPPLDEGRVNTEIWVKDSSGKNLFDIPVWIQIVSDIEYSPSVIVLHPDDAADARRQIVLRYGRIKEFSVEQVLVPTPAIEVSVHELDGYGYRIQLTGIPARDDMNGRNIIIETDLEGSDPIVIPLVFDDTN